MLLHISNFGDILERFCPSQNKGLDRSVKRQMSQIGFEAGSRKQRNADQDGTKDTISCTSTR